MSATNYLQSSEVMSESPSISARTLVIALRLSVITIVLALAAIEPALSGELPAFPGAEGYGARTTGGRGGRVIAVTNLNASGPGSFRAAIEAKGPRIVVFRVAGTIDSKGKRFSIKNDNITIAGQTAPGDGICLKGDLALNANDVIIRYIRVRPDPVSREVDAIFGRYKKNIILDHVSTSWSSDEVLSVYHNEHVTLQWCLISEACAKGDSGHRFGGIWGNNLGTYHHNLIAHNDSRNPRWASGCGYNDYRNNVIYNWGYNSCYGGEGFQNGRPDLNFSTINMVANYYKTGPATRQNVRGRIAAPSSRDGDAGSWFVADNVVEGFPEITRDNWLGITGDEYKKLTGPWDAMPIDQQSPEEAYEAVLAHAGCSFPNRDSIDARIIEEVRTGTAKFGANGIITTPKDVGGWPKLKSAEPPADADEDGMPDDWEKAHDLNPDDASDAAKDRDDDGYTNIEEYVNGLVN